MSEPIAPTPQAPSAPPARTPGARRRGGPDRVTVALSSLAAFLLVLAVLATQLHARPVATHRGTVLLRRIYRTTVIERVLPAGTGGAAGGTSVSQSVSGSSAGALPAAALPVTRTS
jgi:hypothetical protein